MQKTSFIRGTLLRIGVTAVLLFGSTHIVEAQISPSKVAKQSWLYVKTDHFSLITDVSEKRSLRIMQNLEKFRSMVNLFNGGGIASGSRPLKLIVTKNKKMYQELSSHRERLKKTTGFFRDTIGGNYAVLRFRRSFDFSTLFHEYTHYLMADTLIDNLPYWYSEGLAEFMGQIDFKGENQIYFGKAVAHHVSSIAYMKWVDMEDILTARQVNHKDEQRRYQTYSQGWLTVHYFNSSADRYDQLKSYLRLTGAAVSEEEALRQAMGMSFSDLDRALKDYARKGRYYYSKIVLKDPLKQSDIKIRELSSAEVSFKLGEYFLHGGGDSSRAKTYFDQALGHQSNHVGALAGLASLALLVCKEKICNEAQSLINQALELKPAHVFATTISGHLNARKMRMSNSELEQKEYWNKAVRDYNVAISSDEINIEAITSAGNLYASKGRWSRALDLFETAYSYAPSNYSMRAYMIQAYLANGEISEAEKMANKVRNNNHFSDQDIADFEKWYLTVKELHSDE